MSQVIDRRLNGKNKSAVNRRRFLNRYKKQIKRAIEEAVTKRKITDLEKSEKIVIPSKDTTEHSFHHSDGGKKTIVHPGNKEFIQGDKIPKPPQDGDGQGGSNASNSGEGEDDFVFTISREEFLEMFFEDLALPDLVRKDLATITEFKNVRAGYTPDGVPTNLDVIRSYRNAIGRRIALKGSYTRRIQKIEASIEAIRQIPESSLDLPLLEEELQRLIRKRNKIPLLDPFDLRFRHRIKVAQPSTQAVMFCLMDVSGSMDEQKKEMAKRFFILLYYFLKRNYKKIELVFIRHHTTAKEVNEEDFFYSKETGGTVVSSALELMRDIIKERYSHNAWNIYGAQASDGDNWNADSPQCEKILREDILPYSQYFAYVEIMPRHHQSLWESYTKVAEQFKHFAMQTIQEISEIYPIFRELFKRHAA